MKIIQTAEGLALKVSEDELNIIYEDLLKTYIENKTNGIASPIHRSMLKTFNDHKNRPF